MFLLSLIASGAILYATRRHKGPTWAMALAWLLCIAPISLGVITYDFVDPRRWLPDMVIAASMLCVAIGAGGQRLVGGAYVAASPDPAASGDDFERMRRLARILWLAGMAGGACIILDFMTSGGGSLLNLSEVRDSFVTRDSASLAARLGSVLTWACLFCYMFALIFRNRMRARETLFFMVPIAAYMMGAILSAGRQAAFQILIVTIVSQVLYRVREPRTGARSGRILMVSVGAATISYMGFVAVARNDSRISDIKAEVLARLFHYQTAPWFDAVMGVLGSGTRNTITEALVYFSSSIALFDRFLDTRLEGISYGAMNFPFVYRQLQPLTGVDVGAMYQLKVATLDALGVIGVGWTTAISHLLMDFGYPGSAVLLIGQGWLGALFWRRATRGGDFIDCILATLFVLGAVYLPLLPAFADTNMLFLMIFCIGWRLFGPTGAAIRLVRRAA